VSNKYPTWLPMCEFVLVLENLRTQPLVFKGLDPEFQLKQEEGLFFHLELFALQVTELNQIHFTRNMLKGSRKSDTRSRRADCKLTENNAIAREINSPY